MSDSKLDNNFQKVMNRQGPMGQYYFYVTTYNNNI